MMWQQQQYYQQPNQTYYSGYPGSGYPTQVNNNGVYTPFTYQPQYYQQPAYSYNQGGTINVTNGGYNPMTNTVSPTQSATGYNLFADNPAPYSSPYYDPRTWNTATPIAQFSKNPETSANRPRSNPINFQNPMSGQAPYIPQYSAPMAGPNGMFMNYNPGFGNMAGYYNATFNAAMNNSDYFYLEESGEDINQFISSIIYADDDERKIAERKRNLNNSIVGYDYYGNPIYCNNAAMYERNRLLQEEYDRNTDNQFEVMFALFRTASAGLGKEFTKEQEEKIRDAIDPRRQQNITQKQQPKSIYSMNNDEREDYIENQNLAYCANAIAEHEAREQQLVQLTAQRNQMYAKIKESHDRMLGIEPGQRYDLSTYLTNGYKIGINNEIKRLKSQSRNGSLKYSGEQYRKGLGQQPIVQPMQSIIAQAEAPVKMNNPITLPFGGTSNSGNNSQYVKDDEIVSVTDERVFRQAYEYSKIRNSKFITSNPNAADPLGSIQPQDSYENKLHQAFSGEISNLENRDRMIKAVNANAV